MAPYPIHRPYEYQIDYDCREDTYHILVPVTQYPEEEGGFTVFVLTALRHLRDETYELSYGAWCYDEDNEFGWAEFGRQACKDLFHPDVLPDILTVVRRSTRKLIGCVRPETIHRRTYESMPWGFMPRRYRDTTLEVNRCGYWLALEEQCIHSRRWFWEHDALEECASCAHVDSTATG